MTESVLITPLGSPLVKGWSLIPIRELCSLIGSGSTPKGGKTRYKDSGIPFVRSQNVYDHRFSKAGLVFLDEATDSSLGSLRLMANDVLINITGDGDTIARCCVAPESIKNARCNQHVMVLRTNEQVIPNLLQRQLSNPAMREYMLGQSSGGSRRALTKGQISEFLIPLPPLKEQQAIVATLGVLDNKISVNERIADTSRQLGVALYKESITSEPRSIAIEGLSSYLNRGQAPKYTEDEDGMTVLNQRCVRSGRVLLAPARRTLAARVQEARRLKHGDVLVNSTGVGTLGRVAIWTHATEATVDSHVTIVRINPDVVPAVVGGFAMLAAQPRIEALGEGSTGQTELSKAKLGQLEIEIPSGGSSVLAARLASLEEKADAALVESRTLSELRDTLLPQLMSGKLRVRDAEKIVEDNV